MENEEINSEEIILPEVDVLKLIYYNLKGKVEAESDAVKRDLTDELRLYLKQKVIKGELIVININGEVGTGKSTVALQLQYDINRIIEELFDKEIDDFRWIASDQTEFLRLSRTKDENICVEVDEISAFASTGANATTEMAEYSFFSNVCRIQYIHRIICSPAGSIDPNALIVLRVVGPNKENKMTKVNIIYRNMSEGQSRTIGYAWIDVSKILEQNTYTLYEKKKKERINLLKVVGVRDIRPLEFAMVSLEVVDKLLDIARRNKINLSTIRTSINKACRILQLQASYIAEDEIAKPIHSILDNVNSMTRCKEKGDREFFKELIQDEINELVRLRKAYVEYMNIK